MGRNHKLSHAQKLKVVNLHLSGWKVFAIQGALKRENVYVSWAAVKYVITQYEIGNFRAVEQTGKKELKFKTLTNNDLKLIKDTLEKDFTTSAREVKRVLEENGTVLSLTTIKKAITAAGYVASKPRYCQMIREPNKVKRVEFCQDLINADEKFDDVIFSDECSIQLHDNNTVAYRKIDACAPMKCKPKHPLKIHLWGAITKKGPSPLLVFEGIMDSTFYTEHILSECLLPFIRTAFPESHRFIQDNDPKHRSRKAKEFMETNEINWVSNWPSESCDLNPIEMVWNMLKRHVAKKDPTTKNELVDCCNEFWYNELTPEVCQRFVEHNFKVVPLVVALEGKATGDLPQKLFKERSEGKSIGHFESILRTDEVSEKLQRLK